MRRWTAITLLLFSGCFVFVTFGSAQGQKPDKKQAENKRKIVNQVMPSYPEIARRMHLNGVVKIEVDVASNGTVKDVSLKGGHPVLAEAAMEAVRKWKWEPAPHETEEPIEVKFEPDK